MKLRYLTWLIFGTLVGAVLGVAFGKGDPRAPLFVGVFGALLGFLGFLAVSAISRAWKIDVSKTNYLAIFGGLLGAIGGGVIGALGGFGRLMISIFNPDLPERDWGAFFGATGGIFLGAFTGACLVSVIAIFIRRATLPNDETADENNGEENVT
jgi:hypothetical protein